MQRLQVQLLLSFNHGQCCCAGSRLFAHEKIFDKVTEGIAKIAENIKVGPGMDTSTEMGPLVSDEQFQKFQVILNLGSPRVEKLLPEENMTIHQVDTLFIQQFLQKQTQT